MIATTYPHITATQDFTRKQIAITFFVPKADGSFDSFTVGQGHAIQAIIKHAGFTTGSEAEVSIKGLSHKDRDSLSIIPDHPTLDNLNTTTAGQTVITIQAGDEGAPLTHLFTGTIDRAYTDYDDLDIPFHVHAMTSTILASILPQAKGYDGPQNVTTLLADICREAGFQLLDHGGWERHTSLTNHYRWGTALDQIQTILKATKGIFSFSPFIPVKGENERTTIASNQKAIPYKGLLEIWGPTFTGLPQDGQEQTVPVISAETGMIGYPRYSNSGISLTTLLQPDITFWHPLMLDSAYLPVSSSETTMTGIPPWNGLWLATFVWHDISTETPHGPWHTHMDCIRTTLGRR